MKNEPRDLLTGQISPKDLQYLEQITGELSGNEELANLTEDQLQFTEAIEESALPMPTPFPKTFTDFLQKTLNLRLEEQMQENFLLHMAKPTKLAEVYDELVIMRRILERQIDRETKENTRKAYQELWFQVDMMIKLIR